MLSLSPTYDSPDTTRIAYFPQPVTHEIFTTLAAHVPNLFDDFGRQQSFQRLAAVRRGDIREEPEEEPPSPRWTPFPDSPLLIRLRKAVLLELGPFSLTVYSLIFLNAFVLSLDHAGASESKEEALTGVSESVSVEVFACDTVVRWRGYVWEERTAV